MGRRMMPIGTIRNWQGGDVIKAYENSIFGSGWIPLSTNLDLETIGRNCDSLGNAMIHKTVPINGEMFLDHEIEEFDKDDSNGKHPYNPNDFKQYQGLYGAGRYSFRNEFSKRFMANKIKLAADQNEALLNEQGAAVDELRSKNKSNSDINKKEIHISKSTITSVKKEIKDNFKAVDPTKEIMRQAVELQSIVVRTKVQLDIGVNFPEGSEEKKAYDNALIVAKSLPEKYERIKIKQTLKDNTLKNINDVFHDNWGVRESVKKLLQDKFGEYVRKYSKQITNDEAHDQETLFGVKLDDSIDKFYKGLFAKVKKDKESRTNIDLDTYLGKKIHLNGFGFDDGTCTLKRNDKGYYLQNIKPKNQYGYDANIYYIKRTDGNDRLNKEAVDAFYDEIAPSKYPFKELLYLRFEVLYQKQLDGDWRTDMLPTIYNIEKTLHKLPAGHFLTNDELQQVTNKDYGGSEGYAWYSPSEHRINLSDKAVNSFQVWGDLNATSVEFNSVVNHEIGHAVSNKFGRAGNLDYKKFVVACGWSYQQFEWKDKQFHATAGDRDIERQGTHSDVSLLTQYSHKAPEEAFAEYYSIYANNKEAIDKWLATGNEEYLDQKSKLVVSTRKEGDLKPVSSYYTNNLQRHTEINDYIFKHSELQKPDHIKVELINPWKVKYEDEHRKKLEVNVDNLRYAIKEAREEFIRPIIAVQNKLNDYTCLEAPEINEGCKYTRKFAPALIISGELYDQLKKANFDDTHIKAYVIEKTLNARVPIQDSKPIFKKGLEYRYDILKSTDVARNKDRFLAMQKIFNSKKLQKALLEIQGIEVKESIFTRAMNHIRNIFKAPTTTLINESGIEEDILKAKLNSLVNRIEKQEVEITNIKSVIDNE